MRKGPRTFSQRSEPKLSLCMIVKNEAGTLERCLSNARPFVDEIVVVDTGSTDGTLEIARKYADVLDEIEWPDSFSAARNHSLDLASGDFVLILDGDEYIEDEEGWKSLRAGLQSNKIVGLQLPVMNLMPEGEMVLADRIWQERVFLNHPSLRYSGKVHNQIQSALVQLMERTNRTMHRVHAEIVHTGYALAKEKMKEKYRPRLSLLLYEYENPSDAKHRAYYGYQLALVYFVLQEYRKALDIFNAIDYTKLIDLNAFYTHMLAAQTAFKLQDVPAALIHSDGMLTRNRNEPVAYLITGYALLAAKQLINGLMMLVECYNVKQDNDKSARFVLNERMCLRAFARVCEQVGLKSFASEFRRHEETEEFDAAEIRKLIERLKIGLVQLEMNQAA